jgi:hypothetical protein
VACNEGVERKNEKKHRQIGTTVFGYALAIIDDSYIIQVCKKYMIYIKSVEFEEQIFCREQDSLSLQCMQSTGSLYLVVARGEEQHKLS